MKWMLPLLLFLTGCVNVNISVPPSYPNPGTTPTVPSIPVGTSSNLSPTPTPTEAAALTPTPHPTNGIPDLTKAVAIKLPDPTDYSGMSEILGGPGQPYQIYPPIVGDPQVELQITAQRSGAATGTILLGIEDNYGWGGTQVPTYDDISTVFPSAINLVFYDNLVTIWVSGSVDSSGTFNGQIFYRVRQSGETQCEPITVNCDPNYYGQANCDAFTNQAKQSAISACESYLQNMKTLGSFSQTFSTWISIQ